MGKLKDAYLKLLERLDADGDLTQTPIFDKLEREWEAKGFLPIGK
jgi:hypothetical protein